VRDPLAHGEIADEIAGGKGDAEPGAFPEVSIREGRSFMVERAVMSEA
jgi:hypothetical protein